MTGEMAVQVAELFSGNIDLEASELQFELAARYRDEVSELKRELRGMQEAGQA